METPNYPIALITGASGGIGKAFADVCAKNGYGLVLVARTTALLEALAEQYTKEYGVPVYPFTCDLAKPTAPEQVMHFLVEKNLTIDLLINNAGIGVYGLFWETNWADEQELLSLNVMVLTTLTKLLLPPMIKRGKGKILNIGSLAGFYPGTYMPLYYASKAYVLSFSEAVAQQLKGTGVHLAVYCVGPTTTNFAKRTGGGETLHRGEGLFMTTAQEVAERGFRELQRGTSVIMPGFSLRLLVGFSRLLPHVFVVWLIRRSQEWMR